MHLRVKITLFMTESSQFKVENHLNQKFNWSHRQMMLNGILNAVNKLYCHDIYAFFLFISKIHTVKNIQNVGTRDNSHCTDIPMCFGAPSCIKTVVL